VIRILLDKTFDNEHHYIHAVGLSTDTKPTTGIITGSKFVAVDTGAGYLFDETAGEWNENPQLSEAVAAYLDEHPEALDEAAIEAIFDERLDGIESDIGVLKSAVADLEEGSLSALGATAGQVPVADGLGSWAWGAQAGGTQTIHVSGTTPVITAVANTQYICGEVATLDITLPASGCIDVLFKSGSTPTVLTVTPPTGVTVKWANGFDPTALETNTTYEINIMDGLGVGAAWM
jgi:hypothetical protein